MWQYFRLFKEGFAMQRRLSCVFRSGGDLDGEKTNAQSEQLDLSACVLLCFIWFMKGLGAFEVSAACGELAFPAFGREQ